MKRNFHSTMNATNYKIIKIIRFNNKHLLFQQTMYDHILSFYKSKSEQKLLFHGTNLNHIPKIVQNGFNRDFNQRALYGKGVYFSTNARYCSIFASNKSIKGKSVIFPKSNKIHCLLVCNVLIGDCCKGTANMDYAPYKPDGITQYDTLVDDVSNPKVFVVTRDYHAIPKYCIQYKVISNDTNDTSADCCVM